MMRVHSWSAGLVLAALMAEAADSIAEPLVVFGDPHPSAAVVLLDAPGASFYEFRYRPAADAGADWHTVTGRFDRGVSGTTHLLLEGLMPETRYAYILELSGRVDGSDEQPAGQGGFITAPASDARRSVRFAFDGDLGGQNVCRDAAEGYPIFPAIVSLELDFFVALGDMIYADDVCEPVGRYGNEQIPRITGPAGTLAEFTAHWRYNRADAGLRQLLTQTPYVAVWDDHEVLNDFGPGKDLRPTASGGSSEHLMPIGLEAFLEQNPLLPPGAGRNRLYRTIDWGQLLTLFILDTRQYRSRSELTDTPANGKTLLGAEQLQWLEASLRNSSSTWKIIVSSVPLGIPTGRADARDGWASGDGETGYEREVLAILRHMKDIGLRNVVWITTDVHFATVLRYIPFDDAPDFVIHEIVAGPLQAGQFPKKELDPTLHPERLFFLGATSPQAVQTFAQAREYVNFGLIEIDTDGRLQASLRDVDGTELYRLQLAPR